jgi:hypothetical protein
MLISDYKGLNLFATKQTKFRQIFLTRVNKADFCKIDRVNDVFFTEDNVFPTSLNAFIHAYFINLHS